MTIALEQLKRILRRFPWPENVKPPTEVSFRSEGPLAYRCFLGRHPLVINVSGPTPEFAFRWAVNAWLQHQPSVEAAEVERLHRRLAREMLN